MAKPTLREIDINVHFRVHRGIQHEGAAEELAKIIRVALEHRGYSVERVAVGDDVDPDLVCQ
jgi:hypothetical protein